jgi:hypothetical protein
MTTTTSPGAARREQVVADRRHAVDEPRGRAARGDVGHDLGRIEALLGRDRIAGLREDRRQHGLVGAGERVRELALEDAAAARVRARLEHRANAAAGIAKPQRRSVPATAVGWCAKSSTTGHAARLADDLLAPRDTAELASAAADGSNGTPHSRATSITPSAFRALMRTGHAEGRRRRPRDRSRGR